MIYGVQDNKSLPLHVRLKVWTIGIKDSHLISRW